MLARTQYNQSTNKNSQDNNCMAYYLRNLALTCQLGVGLYQTITLYRFELRISQKYK